MANPSSVSALDLRKALKVSNRTKKRTKRLAREVAVLRANHRVDNHQIQSLKVAISGLIAMYDEQKEEARDQIQSLKGELTSLTTLYSGHIEETTNKINALTAEVRNLAILRAGQIEHAENKAVFFKRKLIMPATIFAQKNEFGEHVNKISANIMQSTTDTTTQAIYLSPKHPDPDVFSCEQESLSKFLLLMHMKLKVNADWFPTEYDKMAYFLSRLHYDVLGVMMSQQDELLVKMDGTIHFVNVQAIADWLLLWERRLWEGRPVRYRY
jgi:hypothetical protein